MPLWKILDHRPARVAETGLRQEKLLEQHLEDWIATDPGILGERLLIIGRQVLIPDTKDRLDLLALDPQGNAVVVELKRGHLKDPVDIQALRYASYIWKWRFEDFEAQARNFFGAVGDPEFNFNARFESFCEEAGVDEVPPIGQDQRVIVVGTAVREKLGSVALWLREHSVDIKVVEVQVYKDGEAIFLQPSTIVPVPVSRFVDTGRVRAEGLPWVTDGKAWHLEKRCSFKTRAMFEVLDKIVQDRFDVDGPRWNQKNYVAYRVNNTMWLAVTTRPKLLGLDFYVRAGAFTATDVATRLSIETFDKEDPLSEKFNLPSSVAVHNRSDNRDRIRIRAKEGFDLESPAFLGFLEDAYKALPK